MAMSKIKMQRVSLSQTTLDKGVKQVARDKLEGTGLC